MNSFSSNRQLLLICVSTMEISDQAVSVLLVHVCIWHFQTIAVRCFAEFAEPSKQTALLSSKVFKALPCNEQDCTSHDKRLETLTCSKDPCIHYGTLYAYRWLGLLMRSYWATFRLVITCWRISLWTTTALRWYLCTWHMQSECAWGSVMWLTPTTPLHLLEPVAGCPGSTYAPTISQESGAWI